MNLQSLLAASTKSSKFVYKVFTPKARTERRPQPLAKIVNQLVKMSHDAEKPAE